MNYDNIILVSRKYVTRGFPKLQSNIAIHILLILCVYQSDVEYFRE